MGERLHLQQARNEKGRYANRTTTQVHPRRNCSDLASAREENCKFSLEGKVVVAALSWHVHVREALQ